MKRGVAIGFLGLLLFNWVGYQAVIAWLERTAGDRLRADAASGCYDEASLVHVKVAASYLAYAQQSPVFEPAQGELTVGGIVCRYVKKRFYQDSVEVLCLPSAELAALKAAKFDFFQAVNDLLRDDGASTGQHNHALKHFAFPDYLGADAAFSPLRPLVALRLRTTRGDLLPEGDLSPETPPPSRA